MGSLSPEVLATFFYAYTGPWESVSLHFLVLFSSMLPVVTSRPYPE